MNIPKPKKRKSNQKNERKKEVQNSEDSNKETKNELNVGLPDIDLKKFLGCGG